MKTTLVYLLLLFSVSACAQQQRMFFRLSDTVFQVGSVYTSCSILPQEKPVLRPEEQPCLDSIIDFMFSHPGMVMEIGCHTDFYGSDTFNVRISQNHANTIKRYFVSRGISSYDLAAVGYGESQLLNNEICIRDEPDTQKKDELHSKNRRTEFKILRTPYPAFTLSSSVFRVGDMMQPRLNYDLSKCTVRPECYPWLDSLVDFLKSHHKVRVSLMFFGREMQHRDLGNNMMARIEEGINGVGVIEQRPQLYGNRMVSILVPHKG